MSNLYTLAKTFNSFYLSGFGSGRCRPFVVEGHQVGLVPCNVVKQLLRFPEVFHVYETWVELNPAFRDYKERSDNVDRVLRELRADQSLITLKGWRDECYEVRTKYASKSLLKMERSATCLFGIKQYGVHINGYVRHPNRGLCVWLQQRSATKQTWPNMWDNLVGGGISVGFGILETAYKEANEEASIPPEMMRDLTSAGSVSFYFECERGLFPNTEFVFDLELPVDFVPVNKDGEVQNFDLVPAKECAEKILSADFKLTSAPVVLDFLIRHGVVAPEKEPNYAELIELVHVPLQTIYDSNKWGSSEKKSNGQDNIG